MAGGTPRDDDDLIVGINITPMVDIILVLLIIFMVTTTVMDEQGIDIELPEAATGKTTESTPLGITIDREGRWYLNGQPTDDPELRAFIREQKAAGTELQALVAADRAVAHGEVVRVIDLVKQEGVFKFALNIDPAALPAGAPPPAAAPGPPPAP